MRWPGVVMACGLLSVAAGAQGSAAHVSGDPAVSQRAPQRTYHVLNYTLSLQLWS